MWPKGWGVRLTADREIEESGALVEQALYPVALSGGDAHDVEELFVEVKPAEGFEVGPEVDPGAPTHLGRVEGRDGDDRTDVRGCEAQHIDLAGRAVHCRRHGTHAQGAGRPAALVLDPGLDPLRFGESAPDGQLEIVQEPGRVVEDRIEGEVVGDLGVCQDDGGAVVLGDGLDAGLDQDALVGRFDHGHERAGGLEGGAAFVEDEVDVDVFGGGEWGRGGRAVMPPTRWAARRPGQPARFCWIQALASAVTCCVSIERAP